MPTPQEKRTALYANPIQPLTKRDTNIIGQMIQDYETVIVAITGADTPISQANPFGIGDRVEMVRKVYGDRVQVVTVDDIPDATPHDQAVHILQVIEENGLPTPTDLCTGSEEEVATWKEFFYWSTPYQTVSPADEIKYQVGNIRRWLHVFQSHSIVFPKHSELRSSIEKGDAGWRYWVPQRNIDLVRNKYPKQYLKKVS